MDIDCILIIQADKPENNKFLCVCGYAFVRHMWLKLIITLYQSNCLKPPKTKVCGVSLGLSSELMGQF